MKNKIYKFLLLISLLFIIFNFRFLFSEISFYQQKIIEKIDILLNNHTELIGIILFALTFFYGLIHSLGPGHGKTLIISYVIKENLNFTKILLLSSMIAYSQAILAYLIVKFIINLSNQASMFLFYNLDNKTRLISSIFIILIGFYNIFHLIKNKNHEEITINNDKKNLFLFSLSIALCPCPGVMTILLFLESLGYSNNLFLYSLSTATGIFVIILMFAYLAMKLKKSIVDEKNSKTHNLLSFLGSFILILFGIFQIYLLY